MTCSTSPGATTLNDNVSTSRFGIDNLFDKAPPLIAVDTSVVPGDGLAGGRYDAGNYDVLGRASSWAST